MRLFNRVAIIGTGLIGGSIGLEIKKRRLAGKVVGVSRHKKSIIDAKRIGAIDAGSLDLSIIRGSDCVIFATPINTIIGLAPRIARLISDDCVVTDVGSTKGQITAALEKVFPLFVGSHPLAGSERRGIAAAQKDLFKGTICILTPTRKTDIVALHKINQLWRIMGARTVLGTPEAHDKVMAFISHLPHAVAFSLVAAVPEEYMIFAAGGLKDTTRIAASDPELWAQIFLSNTENTAKAIDVFQKKLSLIRLAIKNKNKRKLLAVLEQTSLKRKSIT